MAQPDFQRIYDCQVDKWTRCRPTVGTAFTLSGPDSQRLYDCLAKKYVRVGSNICEQFKRISGCTGAPSLWYTCGDVRPDPDCPPRRTDLHPMISRLGLVCIRNPPDPNFKDCPGIVHGYAKKAAGC